MGPTLVGVLLVAVCLVSFLGGSSAVCCTDKMTLKFVVDHHNCYAVGANKVDHLCEVTVCGDGSPLVGTYCGRGPCNVFGCDCDDGCHSGDWAQSFLANYPHDKIQLVDVYVPSIWDKFLGYLWIVPSSIFRFFFFFLF